MIFTYEFSDKNAVLRETWRSLELLLDSGRCRSIGVSNFMQSDLIDLMEEGEVSVVPQVNQCEFHPFQNPKQLRTFCEQNNKIQFQVENNNNN